MMTSSTISSSEEAPADRTAIYDDLREGETFGLTLGPETYFPVRFNGFAVGPIYRTTTVRPGETGSDAYLRLKRFLEAALRQEFEDGWKRFGSRLVEVKGKR